CFFLQAEDGIRDWSVTGVQTCALPIYARVADRLLERRLGDRLVRELGQRGLGVEGLDVAGTPKHEQPDDALRRRLLGRRGRAGEIGRASCRERGEGGGGQGAVIRDSAG